MVTQTHDLRMTREEGDVMKGGNMKLLLKIGVLKENK